MSPPVHRRLLIVATPKRTGRPADSRPLETFLSKIQNRGLELVSFEFSASDPEASIESQFEECCREQDEHSIRSITLGGFSLGARVAARVAKRIESVNKLLLLGFPFHQHGDPTARYDLAEILPLTTPTLIIQGTRDSHGNRQQVTGYRNIPACVRIHWIEDGNHRWRARREDVEEAALRHSVAVAVASDFLALSD